ncbi:MAG: retroviral-like aspartic protease family protein [Chloroflexota bacterium]
MAIRFAAPGESFPQTSISALIDTGADATIIPRRVLAAQGLQSHRQALLRPYGGPPRTVELVLIDLEIAEMRLPSIEVVSTEVGDEFILGRNILNKLHMVLDGPGLQFEVRA